MSALPTRIVVAMAMAGTVAAFLPNQSSACTCGTIPAFFEIMDEYEYVVRARVIIYGNEQDHGTYSDMRIEIVEHLKGDTDVARLTIRGGYGASCGTSISKRDFSTSKEYLFAVSPDENGEAGPLSICHESWVVVEDNHFMGKWFDGSDYVEYKRSVESIRRELAEK